MDGTSTPPGQPEKPVRPEFIAEKFWDAEKGAPRIEDLAKAHATLESNFGKGKAAYEAERLKARPPAADKYGLVPKKLPEGLVFLDKAPGDDWKPEAGKRYFALDEKHPLLGWWRQHAWDNGLSEDQFQAGLVQFAEAQAAAIPTEEQAAQQREAFYTSLGEHGKARADHVWKGLQAKLGDKAKALDELLASKEAFEAIESLMEAAGEKKFAPAAGVATPGAGDRTALETEYKKIMAEKDWRRDPAKADRVSAIFKILYPGQAQTAATNPSFAR